MVEHRLPKPRVASSNLVIRSNIFYADVAQLVEQLIRNQQVGGSIPPVSSKKTKTWLI